MQVNNNNGNYAVYPIQQRMSISPTTVFNHPKVYCFMGYLGVCLLLGGIALIITFVTSDDQFSASGFMVGGMICLFLGFMFGVFSFTACRVVQSFAYIMTPCCVNESDRKRLEEQAKARTPMLNFLGMPAMNQQQLQMMNQQMFQAGGFQNQVQPNTQVPMVVQAPMQAQQQFVNQQYIPVPMQAPNVITAPAQLEISPVM
ncbi:Hypothetical_protein [Hexamita inflata]|uniref:Hypothetical_protein n=1 Tax=Hexamita inflata TaxID=28002 RepID=A0AA86NY02_9EUKA|nr:Hypothetical protein HINF_LOCUS15053 [Hexamita inflata]